MTNNLVAVAGIGIAKWLIRYQQSSNVDKKMRGYLCFYYVQHSNITPSVVV